jgi:hypothetical protein
MPHGVNAANWAQTVPGKGWNALFRLYDPLQPWFDKTWRVGEIGARELIESGELAGT